ncbi:GIY-YIG nuclease family protein [Alteromonas ponticola]|uniref:GIY-YIG nuclease family protein n=1 Tax=Alteromonas ponticola TaxID=2720613 RepID=UPI001FE282DA|nr:GIY-YIG nuclease family protein [Alteromonas ponticola]
MRVCLHRNKPIQVFSTKYNLTKLMYLEQFSDMESANLREKRVKQWHRSWKN